MRKGVVDCNGRRIAPGDVLVPRGDNLALGQRVLAVEGNTLTLQSVRCGSFLPPYPRTQDDLDRCAVEQARNGRHMGGWQVKEAAPLTGPPPLSTPISPPLSTRRNDGAGPESGAASC